MTWVEFLREQFARAVETRSGIDGALWAIFGIFWAAQAVLLVAAFSNGDFAKPPVGILVSIAGLGTAAVSLAVQDRVLQRMKRLNELIQRIETALLLGNAPAVTGGPPGETERREFTLSTYLQASRLTGFQVNKVMRVTSTLAVLGWAALLALFACRVAH